MKELGVMSTKYHLEILDLINEVDIKYCVFLCDLDEEKILKEKFSSRKIIFKNNKSEVAKLINDRTSKDDFVLIKGSRYWELEEVISLIH